jgi:voltage-gated potassium channel
MIMANPDERWNLLKELDEWLRLPMAMLSFVWLFIVVAELVWGEYRLLSTFGLLIWAIFLFEFAIRFVLAPAKLPFLRTNWLTILSLMLPALRLFRALRILRAARALRGARLVRIVGTANRSMKALRSALHRRHFGYVTGLTLLIVLLGAAGMLNFEPASEVSGGFAAYGDALWWTAMLVTSIGSDLWPSTLEGRALTLLLSIYGLAVFGYITASFASFFVGRDAETPDGPVAGREDVARLTEEIRALRQQLDRASQ